MRTLGFLGRGLGARRCGDLSPARTPTIPGCQARTRSTPRASLRHFAIVLYHSPDVQQRAPAVVFLPGRFAPEDQYESYARALASRGFVVAVRGQYSWFYADASLRRDAVEIADWLRARDDVDPTRIAVAGHSMGGRDALWAAASDPRFAAVVAVDRFDRGTAARGRRARDAARARAVDRRGRRVARTRFCGRRGTNYNAYFDDVPNGARLVEIHGADHVQVMDAHDLARPASCRFGPADSTTVRRVARGATVQFLAEQLQGALPRAADYSALATSRTRARAPGDRGSRTRGA